MFKKYVGLDLLDVLIQFGVTMAAGVMLSGMTQPNEEIGASIAAGVSLIVLAWRRKRALTAMASLPTGEVQAERIAELELRVADLEQSQGRILDLEERLDFTERVLARQREPEANRLSAGHGE